MTLQAQLGVRIFKERLLQASSLYTALRPPRCDRARRDSIIGEAG